MRIEKIELTRVFRPAFGGPPLVLLDIWSNNMNTITRRILPYKVGQNIVKYYLRRYANGSEIGIWDYEKSIQFIFHSGRFYYLDY